MNNLPKELENNLVIRKLFEKVQELSQENEHLKAQIINNQQTERKSFALENNEIHETVREIIQRDKEGFMRCQLCSSKVNQWRQQVRVYACDPDCASMIEQIALKS